MSRRYVSAWLLGGLSCLHACTPPQEELNDQDLKLEVPWEDLTGQVDPDSDQDGAESGGEQIALAKPDKVAPLPAAKRPAVKPEPAVKLQLSNTVPYEGGTLGWAGSAKAYVASTQAVPNDQRLYWVMVKVLSEKYACFMTHKSNRGPQLLVRCSDGRRVLLKRERGADFVQFHARQYDQQGYEVLVKKHQMVRIDGAAALHHVLAAHEVAARGRLATNQD